MSNPGRAVPFQRRVSAVTAVFSMVGCWFRQFTFREGTSMRYRLIPAALAAGASLALLAGPATAAPAWTAVSMTPA